jgi:hypothetical protein
MRKVNKLLVSLLIVMLGSCENLEMDGLQVNPNAPSPDQINVNDLYNNIQLTFNDVFQNANFTPGASTRMYMSVAYTYRISAPNTAFNGLWGSVYNGLFPDVNALIDFAEGTNLNVHLGSSKIMKAFAMMILVDIFGDVPYSETGQGTNVISPSLDSGQDVYNAAVALLDEAIVDLSTPTTNLPKFDGFYGGNASKWIKLANTLKLRAALNTDDVATFNAIVAGANFISSSADDFQFNYGTNRANPDSRHPYYANHYETGDGDYLSNYYMWLLRAEKISATSGLELTDPRIRYYFYRKKNDSANQDQTTYGCHFSDLPDQNFKPTYYEDVDPRIPYCYASTDGYIGRDHLNGEGIPPDGPIRTSYGLYPMGGQFDDNTYSDTRKSGTTGGLGRGISPILLSSFVDFMRAEAVLRLGAAGDARALLSSGITKSLDKVESFESLVPSTMSRTVSTPSGPQTVKAVYGMSATRKTDFRNEVLAIYDAKGSNPDRLDVVIKEYYIAAWGNGLEAYNMYRRTGSPKNMAPALEAEPGPFPLSYFYPSNAVDRNPNIKDSQKPELNVPIFWQSSTIAAQLY